MAQGPLSSYEDFNLLLSAHLQNVKLISSSRKRLQLSGHGFQSLFEPLTKRPWEGAAHVDEVHAVYTCSVSFLLADHGLIRLYQAQPEIP